MARSKNKEPPNIKPSTITGTNTGSPYYNNDKKEENNPMKVNFAAVTTSYAPRTAGTYEGTLISHKTGTSANGFPTLSLDWSENDSPNKHMFANYSLQPQSLWSLKRDLIRIGADVEEMNSEDADLDVIIAALYGYTATLKYGDPRPGRDKDGNPRDFDNYIEVVDPAKS